MLEQDIIWTALPNGVIERNGKKLLRLSVFVSPRLKPSSDGEGDLGHFPDFQNWTDKVRNMDFEVQLVNSGQSSTVKAEMEDPSLLNSKMWSKLFRMKAYIKPHELDDYSDQMIISYPVSDLATIIKQKYQYVGLNFGQHLPSHEIIRRGLIGIPDEVIHWNDDIARSYREELKSSFDSSNHRVDHSNSPVRFGNLGNPTPDYDKAFRGFMLFHHKPYNAPEKAINMPGQGGFDKYIDFHQVISSLGDYPVIMRRLGLIIDIVVPADQVTAVPQGQIGELKAVTSWKSSLGKPPMTPSTAYIWDGSHFETAPRPTGSTSQPDIVDGLLRLDPANYDLISMDVDGAVFKSINTALSVENLLQSRPVNMSDEAGLPSIRSGGISLVQKGRSTKVHNKFTDVKANNNTLTGGNPLLLYAEDTIRGYRIDIWDSLSGQWHSLCRRIGEYSFEGSELHPLILGDEGCIQMSMTQTPTPPNSEPSKANDLYMSESILRWEGWSLVASRPGRSISSDPNAFPQRPRNDPVTQFKMKTSFKATPGSLPRLRFGSRYMLRARVVDLAGNSISLEEAPKASSLILPGDALGFKYLRYDPVLAPVVIMRWPMHPDTMPGESLERLVIRSYNSDPSLDEKPTIKTSDRHIAPPRTSQLVAETHGMFDSPSNSLKSDRNTYNMMVEKDRGTFGAGPNPPVRPEEILKLSYLSDPLSRGAAFRNLPGTTEGTIWRPDEKNMLTPNKLPGVRVRSGSATMIDFGPASSWPDAKPFRLILEEGISAPKWDIQKRLLTVKLPKADMAVVPLSSYLLEEDLKIMGIWQWIKEFVDQQVADIASGSSPASEIEDLSDKLADLSQLALEGGFWMLTPSRQITLIHAVQQPIGRPEFKELSASRDPGSNFASLLGEIKIHAKSTMKLDITAQWIEPVDLISEPEPSKYSGMAHVEEVPLIAIDGKKILESGIRKVGRYMPEIDAIRFYQDPTLPLQPPYAPRHEFNDTKHRIVNYRATATSRFREYFTPPKNPQPDFFTRTSDEIVVNVPSSSRPASPKVLYVVPTFGWKRQTSTNLIASERIGGGLRVYLDRPWFSSGEGELLGVVLLNDVKAFQALKPEERNVEREKYKHYITQWGNDPIWASAFVSSMPDVDDFPKKVTISDGSDLSLEETGEIRVKVAGHEVAYDGVRKLWYCDIEVNTGGSYYPFIRMALARYQPDSIDNAHLSKIVLADYAQISPDRSIVITYDPYNPDVLNVAVAGITYTPPSNEPEISSSIEISIESLRQDVGGDLGWITSPGAQIVPEKVQASGNLLWKGQAKLPIGHIPGQKFRIMVKEYERLHVGEDLPPLIDKRLIFAESIEL
jgi:hypothetical protein